MQKSVGIFAFFIRNLSLVLLYNYMGWVNKNVWIDEPEWYAASGRIRPWSKPRSRKKRLKGFSDE